MEWMYVKAHEMTPAAAHSYHDDDDANNASTNYDLARIPEPPLIESIGP